jgi:formylglycine-generating enzyme required for sulfatase activity
MGFLILAALVALGSSGWVLSAEQPPVSIPHSEQVFHPTVPNAIMPPGPAPEGMVWIPGGEFSMGAADPFGNEMNDVGMLATRDSRPIHRVYPLHIPQGKRRERVP